MTTPDLVDHIRDFITRLRLTADNDGQYGCTTAATTKRYVATMGEQPYLILNRKASTQRQQVPAFTPAGFPGPQLVSGPWRRRGRVHHART
jgi:hypothetical protein